MTRGHKPTVTLALASPCYIQERKVSACARCKGDHQGDLSTATPSPLRLQLRDALSAPTPATRRAQDLQDRPLHSDTRIRERPGSIVVTTVGSTNHKRPSENRKKCHAQELAPRKAAGRPERQRPRLRNRLLQRRGTPSQSSHPPTRADRPRLTRRSRTLQSMLERLVQLQTSPPPRCLHHLREPLGRREPGGGHPGRAEHPPSQ